MAITEQLPTDTEDRLGMTPMQWDWFQRHTHGFSGQDENGVDLSLLRENLKLSPTARIEKMRNALELVLEVERAQAAAKLRDAAARSSCS